MTGTIWTNFRSPFLRSRSIWNLTLIGPVVSEEMFENVDGQTNAGVTGIVLLAHPWAFGSVEVKRKGHNSGKMLGLASLFELNLYFKMLSKLLIRDHNLAKIWVKKESFLSQNTADYLPYQTWPVFYDALPFCERWMKLMHPFKRYWSKTKSVMPRWRLRQQLPMCQPCFAGDTIIWYGQIGLQRKYTCLLGLCTVKPQISLHFRKVW